MRLVVLAALLALPACNGLWDNGEITVRVEPTPVRTGQPLAVTVTNGTQRPATFNPCRDLGLFRTGTTFTQVLPAPGTACAQGELRLPSDGVLTERFVLGGVAPGAYVVRFTPMLDGGEALAESPTFQVTD